MNKTSLLFPLLFIACGEVQPKQSDTFTPQTESDSATPTDSADTAIEEDEDYCDYVFLLERRQGNSGYAPYLWKFNPATTNLTELGFIDCPFSSGDYLIAMTADSKGILWLLSQSEYLFRADPSTLSCSATNYAAFDAENNIRSRSLAFMKQDVDSEDQLFFSSYLGNTNPRQGVLTSIVQGSVVVVGEIPGFTGNGAVMELAGSANGRLFGQSFAVGDSSHFIELNPYTGDVLDDYALGIESGNAFTFSIIEGYAWMFLATGNGGVSEIYRYDPDSHDLDYIKTLNTTMLGSAAPTCASTESGS